MLNPVALLRSASSRSTSSRFLMNSSSDSKDEGYESSSDFSNESCMFSGSHQSTIDKLLAWEKKLYQEVRVYTSTLTDFDLVVSIHYLHISIYILYTYIGFWYCQSKSSMHFLIYNSSMHFLIYETRIWSWHH